jgi:hypothetical protein
MRAATSKQPCELIGRSDRESQHHEVSEVLGGKSVFGCEEERYGQHAVVFVRRADELPALLSSLSRFVVFDVR